MKENSIAYAYPGLPVIFAEGFRDYRQRLSGHSHASLALTDIHDMMRTETSFELTSTGVEYVLDGVDIEGSRSEGINTVIREMISLATEHVGVKINSQNHGVLTGSSDSAAAALVGGLDDLLELGLPHWRLEELARKVSETAYRSIYGGLTEYVIDDSGEVKVTQLKKASFFSDIAIYGISFSDKRFSADDLHKRVSRHSKYNQRTVQAQIRLDSLHQLIDSRDYVGFLSLMEMDSKTVHRLFSDMGMDVIRPEMKELTDFIGQLRGHGTDVFWTIAGGSHVYVLTLKKHAKEVTRHLKDKDYRYRNLKVADGFKIK